MRSAVSTLGMIFVIVVFFWIIGESAGHPATFAAAVGQGVKATISFFTGVAQNI